MDSGIQILIRKELPIFLLAAGLNDDIGIIKEDYKKALGLSEKVAYELAIMTKGYAFAYQAFGKYMWESKEKEISPIVLAQVDEALAQKVYDKIWSEPRKHLMDKGIIDGSTRGTIKLRLPRLKEYVASREW